ncbi:MAG: LuxR C-terminal-related transcriptional regulator [Halomonadaceae bacterium]|uniref:Response regulator transcription factor n=1 Tax=Halomonas colorata TaxID=2742615 RepID=A0ABR9G3D4_9GAMM|nr:response regulator transcription factor [Halomonas colorata]MBE0465416.1 response regulator transcription factor [Halomonas colorata]
MTNWFVTTNGDLKSRWEAAFPDAQSAQEHNIESQIKPGDLIWLVTTVETWPALARRLVAANVTVVILSYMPNDREALKALDQGARGYVHTLAAVDVLKQVALVVANQGVWVGQELLSKVLGGSFKALQQRTEQNARPAAECLSLLTEREQSVAIAVTSGAANKEVARQLDITERTVKAHLSAIFKKLGVRDRLQLILKLANNDYRVNS